MLHSVFYRQAQSKGLKRQNRKPQTQQKQSKRPPAETKNHQKKQHTAKQQGFSTTLKIEHTPNRL